MIRRSGARSLSSDTAEVDTREPLVRKVLERLKKRQRRPSYLQSAPVRAVQEVIRRAVESSEEAAGDFCTLGKREVAKTKCRLLAHALLLDGRNDLAAEVEALALTD